MGAKIKVDYDDSKLRANIHGFDDRIQRAIDQVIDYEAQWAVGYMKTHAPWTDDTGAARSGLVAIPFHGKSYAEIVMAYSVHYGIWLEIANDRKYAIITPTVRILGDKVMRDLQHLIDKMSIT